MAVRRTLLSCIGVIIGTCHLARLCVGLETAGEGEYLIRRFRLLPTRI